jgi:hypothetical protein
MSKIKSNSVYTNLNFYISENDKNNISNRLISFNKEIRKQTQKNESEEHLKNTLSDYLKSIYDNELQINTLNKIDLAISQSETPLVLFETKNPLSTNEMISETNFNRKAFHEIFLYYLELTREFVSGKIKRIINPSLKKLIITDFKTFFYFDPSEFDKFGRNGVDEIYERWKNGQLASPLKDDFYKALYDFFSTVDLEKKLSYFCIDLENLLSTFNGRINFYRLCSKHYLLKQSIETFDGTFSLNTTFYNELLYIFGFVERKILGLTRIFINNKVPNSFAMQVYRLLTEENHDPKTIEDKTFELIVTWINRFMFIKLFEGQLYLFNAANITYSILNYSKIDDFDKVNDLFFNVLGKRIEDRDDNPFYAMFEAIPYLNSSLFEMTTTEINFINIRELRNFEIEVMKGSILNKTNKSLPLLQYLIDFLNNYSFTSNDKDNIGKEIINSSVLGLIFEKINGYKEGSYYTPSYVTEFMAKDLVQRLVISRTNSIFKTSFLKIDEITFFIENDYEKSIKLSEMINNLKICDPAVGSGHFLVSILNQIIALKSELNILFIKNTKRRLNQYSIKVQRDVLVIKDGQGKDFYYDKSNSETQLIQETLFHEKRNIIENTLFGVDLNQNAVSICRLRLWIELLKNSYYKREIMVTLPNIDANIKHGNSLTYNINFSTGSKLTNASFGEEEKAILNRYKALNKKYINENSKEYKREIKKQIDQLKNILMDIPNKKISLFGDDLTLNIDERDFPFEWSVEFPEIISEEGKYIGFDGVIANPPYIGEDGNSKIFRKIKNTPLGIDYYQSKMDIHYFFFHLAIKLLKLEGFGIFITTNYYVTADGAIKLRKELKSKTTLNSLINFGEWKVFDSALGQSNVITSFQKAFSPLSYCKIINFPSSGKIVSLQNSYTSINDIFDQQNLETQIINNHDIYYSPSDYIVLRSNKIYDDVDENNVIDYISKNGEYLSNLAIPHQGIITGANSVLKNKLTQLLNKNVKANDGIFVLDIANYNDSSLIQSLSEKEKVFLRPYYKNSDIDLYKCSQTPRKYLIYITNSTINNKDHPNLIKHFDKFRPIIEERIENKLGRIKFYELHRSRDENIFLKPKILIPYRAEKNTFAYTEKPWFFSSDCYCIIEHPAKRVSLFYILGLLNSKTYRIWFTNRGKVKGKVLEFMDTSLKNTPILILSKHEIDEIEKCSIGLVNKASIIKHNIEEEEEYKKIDQILMNNIKKSKT